MRDTIDMAREADEYADMEWPLRPRGKGWQKCRDERFETLVRADEREACAKLCDELDAKKWAECSEYGSGYGADIRARGKP